MLSTDVTILASTLEKGPLTCENRSVTSTLQTTLEHPIATFATRLHTVLDTLIDTPAWSLPTHEQGTVAIDLARARARLDEVFLRVLAAADRSDVAAGTAATSTAAWLSAATRAPIGAARADVALATALDTGHGATREALAAGAIDTAQARVITKAVAAIPKEAVEQDPTVPGGAEATLLEHAKSFDAQQLQRLGRHVLHVLDPEAADERLGRELQAEEVKAARATFLEIHDNGDGTHSGRFKISDLHAAMLRKALDAIMNPARHATGHLDDPGQRTRPELMGQALCELLERLPADRLPSQGGVSATVVILLDFDKLLSGLGTARLDTGEQVSAALARRLACEAGVIPAVIRRLVDGRSVVLDMGRKRRLHTEHQRIALTIEQGGCTAEACTRPAGWCHAHHVEPWASGGGTSVSNGRLLCGHHHRKAHSPDYDTHRLPDGQLRFHRRT